MAYVYRVSRAGISIQLLFSFGIPRIPQPGSRMYEDLTTALFGYWIDTDQVVFCPPQPRLSDAFVELVLPDEGVLIRFSYEELSVTVNDVINSNPKEISTILEALGNVVTHEMPNKGSGGPVVVRYWAHAYIPTGGPSTVMEALGQQFAGPPGLEIETVTLRLPPNERPQPDISIEVGTSSENPNGLFLDYNAVIDKEPFISLPVVVSEALKSRGDLLGKLNLTPNGGEEFTSWFVTGPVRDDAKR